MDKSSRGSLQAPLKNLISQTITLWGDCLKETYGEKFYQGVEKMRQKSKAIAKIKTAEQTKELNLLLTGLRKKETLELHQLAIAFSLMLELINRCETVYRTQRLKLRAPSNANIPKKSPYALIYVFTAHPTEARSEEVLKLFKIIEASLQQALEKGFETVAGELAGYLKLALRISIVKTKRPTVEDEAISIYRYSLSEEILNLQCELKNRELTLHFRSWVGGDKDGHPGVDEKTLLMSLTHSRQKIIDFMQNLLQQTHFLIDLMESETKIALKQKLKVIEVQLNGLRAIKKNDGTRVAAFMKLTRELSHELRKAIGERLAPMQKLENLMWIYPALVLPLEIREDSEIVSLALKDKKLAIARMLVTLKDISEGLDPRWYVRGFVLSMCEEAAHLTAANQLLKQIFNKFPIPVIPLFENERALTRGEEILGLFFKQNPHIIKEHLKWREGRFEIMLGYSDSSKENGVLASRVLIYETLSSLDRFLKSFQLTPVFFHGSGGSVERGGGSIKEQIAWWPESALNIYKVTVQGEMVARTLANREVLSGQVDKILTEFAHRSASSKKVPHIKALKTFAHAASGFYKELVASDDFWDLIESCTPYDYLDSLKIGSRPSKRSGSSSRRKLRAIPWVLCWTQVRLLLPTWWGVGQAWKDLSAADQLALIKRYRADPFLQSFAKSFGFTLKKIELGIFQLYLSSSSLEESTKKSWRERIANELELATQFINELTGEKELIWERPWLAESIELRSPNITPLNLIQMIALERKESHLLRESVTGIATGMLTTG